MQIAYTKHALRKREILKELGWDLSLNQLEEAVKAPDFEGKTNQGQRAVLKHLDDRYSLRVVYEIRGDIISVITFYVARKGRYEK